ncbi:IS5 family transposase [Roseateles sp. SL47]|uniref:IS5 family transposase n=1 Tax=Roseateles sp. SL47 TaxID=2995138 RepID=UPI00226F1764|nr:IS5 family transposase [Roseateles sp. SL47]WAC71383.1 IS5 family transposase [Roseateles sp. SL47]
MFGLTAVRVEYWHKDSLGSLMATTDHRGVVTARYSYDPFGKRRQANGTYDAAGVLVVDWVAAANYGTDRGFTGHEHLDDVGLIHMNGRIYDPTLGVFLQADPMIQSADDLQNYNRYGYCFNNPMTCTDPTGYSFLSKWVGSTLIGGVLDFFAPGLGTLLSSLYQARLIARTKLGYQLGSIAIGVMSAVYCKGAVAQCNALGQAGWAALAGHSASDVIRTGVMAYGHFSKPLSHLTPESVTIQAMITPRIKPSAFWRRQASSDLFVQDRRQEKMGSFIANLAAMDELVDFAAVAAQVEAACPRPDRSKGGRPPYSTEIMVRLVFIQSLYNLSDEECEYQVLDRMSFQHFCRLAGELHIPDARTLWRFKQQLAQGGLGGKAIFEAVSQQLQAHGYIPRGGQIVDASIVQAPVTHTKSEEREALNEGQAPEGWSSKKLRHTDRAARWTKKHGKSHYGYKVHANSDARYKLIRKIKVTPANVDDGQTLKDVLDPSNTGKRVLADRGYDSQANRDLLREQQLRYGIGRRALRSTQIIRVALILGVSLLGGAATATQGGTQVIDVVSGTSQKLIQSALPEFARHGLDLTGYRIVVMTVSGHYVVLFEDLNTPSGQRGTTSTKRSFEVEFDDDRRRVVRANFSR